MSNFISAIGAGQPAIQATATSNSRPYGRYPHGITTVGLELPPTIASPEHKLYLLLAGEKGDAAHSAYNSLIRRLVSFQRAAATASRSK